VASGAAPGEHAAIRLPRRPYPAYARAHTGCGADCDAYDLAEPALAGSAQPDM